MTIRESVLLNREWRRDHPEEVFYEPDFDGNVRRWEPGELFDPVGLVFRGMPRKEIARELDEMMSRVKLSRGNGLEGLITVDHNADEILVLIVFRPVRNPDEHGPWMSFGAAFLLLEGKYGEGLMEAYVQEFIQLQLDSR